MQVPERYTDNQGKKLLKAKQKLCSEPYRALWCHQQASPEPQAEFTSMTLADFIVVLERPFLSNQTHLISGWERMCLHFPKMQLESANKSIFLLS